MKISKTDASGSVAGPSFSRRFEKFDGWTITFGEFTAHDDQAALLAGLPDDACQAVHLGHVLHGKLIFHYKDGTTDVAEAGQAYVTRPGHTPELFPDTEVVEFTRTEELEATLAQMMRNMKTAADG